MKPSLLPPSLELKDKNASQATVTVHGYMGQRIVVQASTDLAGWTSLETNVLQSASWDAPDSEAGSHERRFYRAFLVKE